MIPTPSHSGVPPQLTAVQPVQYALSSCWDADNVHQNLRSLHDSVELMKALQKELEEICLIRQSTQNKVPANGFSSSDSLAGPSLTDLSPFSADSSLTDNFQSFGKDVPLQVSEILKQKRISPNAQESLSLEAANLLILTVKDQLVSFNAITSQTSLWEQRSMAVRLAQKLQKAKRNKRWKKKKRKHIAELLRKDREGYEKADQDADEWRAREIAKDIARRKVESMKEIARLKANEERKRLESELELVLVVEKLQELRSIRIQKLKKQGHFLPEEDDKFLERVRIAVEEEERQAAAAADTDATKDAIATAEVSRKTVHGISSGATDMNFNKGVATLNQEQSNQIECESNSGMDANPDIDPQKNQGQAAASGYDSLANLPFEFYHYYHGSSNDMGTLIEVRRMWDAYIRRGGSRIPGYWVQPPPPANEVWASYLLGPKH